MTAPAAPPPLCDAEVARRAPVWTALAELYLDTMLTPVWLRGIARTLAESGYTLPELDAILRDEVAPVFCHNLLATTGEWLTWDEAYVRDLVVTRLRRRAAWGLPWRRVRVPRAWRRWQVALVRDEWTVVRFLVAEAHAAAHGEAPGVREVDWRPPL